MDVSQQQEVVDKQNTNAKETEDKREQNRLFKGIKVGLMDISSRVGGMYRFLEQSALDAAKKVGGGFLDIAKKFIFGGAILKGFSFAMILGVIIGTYSSIYIANPILVSLNVSQKTILKEEKE